MIKNKAMELHDEIRTVSEVSSSVSNSKSARSDDEKPKINLELAKIEDEPSPKTSETISEFSKPNIKDPLHDKQKTPSI